MLVYHHGPIIEDMAVATIEHSCFKKCSIRNRNIGANVKALSNKITVLDPVNTVLDPVNVVNVKLDVPVGILSVDVDDVWVQP